MYAILFLNTFRLWININNFIRKNKKQGDTLPLIFFWWNNSCNFNFKFCKFGHEWYNSIEGPSLTIRTDISFSSFYFYFILGSTQLMVLLNVNCKEINNWTLNRNLINHHHVWVSVLLRADWRNRNLVRLEIPHPKNR